MKNFSSQQLTQNLNNDYSHYGSETIHLKMLDVNGNWYYFLIFIVIRATEILLRFNYLSAI